MNIIILRIIDQSDRMSPSVTVTEEPDTLVATHGLAHAARAVRMRVTAGRRTPSDEAEENVE